MKINKYNLLITLVTLLWVVGCDSNLPSPETEKERKMRDVDVAEIPEVISALTGQLGFTRGESASFAVNSNSGQFNVSVDWDRIVELIDTAGNVNYTFGVSDPENEPYVFHNLIIGKNPDGYFKDPYLLTYTMSEDFRAEYDATGEIKGFTGKVDRKSFTFGSNNDGENSANMENVRSSAGSGTCNSSNEVTGGGGGSSGGGGSNTNNNPPNLDDNVITICESYWIDFDDDESCGDGCVMASQSIYVTVCYDYSGSSAGSDPCDPSGEVLVVPPGNRCPGNPLKQIEVNSSGASGKKGGTFGYTRSVGTQFHDGLDLTATPGTPFYPMQSGTVIHVRNRFGIYEYEEDSYGNRVIVRTNLPDGSVLDLHYNHLDEIFVQEGQVIDLNTNIGNTGQTGNAARVGITPHLHILARRKINGVYLPKEHPLSNPANYLTNVTILDNGETVQSPCIQ